MQFVYHCQRYPNLNMKDSVKIRIRNLKKKIGGRDLRSLDYAPLFCRERQTNVPRIKMHVHSHCAAKLVKHFVWRCSHPCRCGLLKFPLVLDMTLNRQVLYIGYLCSGVSVDISKLQGQLNRMLRVTA